MALVAYGSSDESDSEQNDTSIIRGDFNRNAIESPSNVKPNGKYGSIKSFSDDDESETIIRPRRPISLNRNAEDDSDDSEDEDNLVPLAFSLKLLPATCHTVADESRIPKSSRLNALFSLKTQTKISEEHVKKNLSSTAEKSSLLSVLPSPSSEVLKHPVAISENSQSKSLPSKLIPRSIKTNITIVQKGTNDEDEEIGADFFSLTKTDSTSDIFEPIDIDSLRNSYGGASKTPTVEKSEKISELLQVEDHAVYESMNYEDSVNMIPGSSDVALDEDALQKLCGRKRKGQTPDEIQLIDVFEDKILAESKEERLKRLSEEVSYRPAIKRGTGPSSLEKRKHQITYLASLAKSRELELKNMWAQNKFTKRQTQSKYGF